MKSLALKNNSNPWWGEFDRVFDNFFGPVGQYGTWPRLANAQDHAFRPAVELSENEDQFELHFDLPGVTKDDVKIEIEEGVLAIRGSRQRVESNQEGGFHYTERSYGSFERRFKLPSNVDGEAIQAKHQDGVLVVTLPKTNESRKKVITVQ